MGVNRVLDELAKLMTDTASAAQGMRKEAETIFRSQAEKALNKLDLVKREDFEALKELVAKTHDETDALQRRIEALEKHNNQQHKEEPAAPNKKEEK